ncbi:hypothetical protein RJ640_007975 [Escallonia rubra]|uniref:Thioglucosidase n=1 Tax=Escallonia rubra TaxID=112253 RepID=A0AA88TZP4_9ASTE|nr:hypothetical protein RJ640_007975 [Escallonia rubra]
MVLRRGIGLGVTFLVVFGVMIQTCKADIKRGSFPKGFVFGTASSAYQYEGAVKEDGRGQTIWDTFAHTFGKVSDFSNADVAVDQYHRYKMELGKSIRQELIITTILLTLYLPMDFAAYAETCFQKFGDRVKHWITFNEPHTMVIQGYDVGLQAPSRCSIIGHIVCKDGNSATEPYIVGHHVLLSHATVTDIYRKKYKPRQRGSLGVAFDVFWYEPATNSTKDIEATQRAKDFHLGFIEPLLFGDYPSIMRSRVGSRLPRFSEAESALLKGTLDFVGVNHYTTWYAWDNATNIIHVLFNDSLADSGSITLRMFFTTPFSNKLKIFMVVVAFRDGKAIADRANSIWLYIVPHGIRSLMNYIKEKYGNPPVIITENGMDDANNQFISLKDALKDEKRIKYHNDYLSNLLVSIKEDGCNVQGYFVWSLMDNWEWGAGFSSRFGLYFVDYNDKLKRYAKDSVSWFKNFLTSN